mgnify:CR=1 FL=1
MLSFKIQKNVLHYYVNLLRQKTWEETDGALHNIIRTMRMSRNDKICLEDLSDLDFGNISLSNTDYSYNGHMPSIFDRSRLGYMNFFTGHYDEYVSLAITSDSKNCITEGSDGTVMWDINTGAMVGKCGSHIADFHNVVLANGVLKGADESEYNLIKSSSERMLQLFEENEELIAVTPNHRKCITVYWDSGSGFPTKVIIWDIVNRKKLHTIDAYDFDSIAVTPDSIALPKNIAYS